VVQSHRTLQTAQALADQSATMRRALHTFLTATQRPFESYVVGNKPS